MKAIIRSSRRECSPIYSRPVDSNRRTYQGNSSQGHLATMLTNHNLITLLLTTLLLLAPTPAHTQCNPYPGHPPEDCYRDPETGLCVDPIKRDSNAALKLPEIYNGFEHCFDHNINFVHCCPPTPIPLPHPTIRPGPIKHDPVLDLDKREIVTATVTVTVTTTLIQCPTVAVQSLITISCTIICTTFCGTSGPRPTNAAIE
ncbi:hypothetical protein DFH27DRAFT_292583 [Peziza echinospora]|nr:hypothetical protein DFH27DRAFT_292583 [Peziza echinospora]